MTTEPIEAETIPETQAVALRQNSEIGLFGTQDPSAVIGKAKIVAQALKDVIVKQGLVSRIQGKEYPRCEAWTLLGTMLGVFPVLAWTKPVEGGWEARVEARTKDGAVIGAAEAQCLRAERNWQNRDDFALRSMAQTRATAKCLRMPLGFVMSLSGFEVTPAEEMVADHPAKPQPKPVAKPEPRKPAACATEEQKARFIKAMEPARELAQEFFTKLDWLLPTEALEDLDLRYVPSTVREMKILQERLTEFGNGEQAGKPYEPHWESEAKPVPPLPKPDKAKDAEAWRAFPMPFGKNAGIPLEQLEKNYLFGLWANYTVETEYKGKPKNPESIAKDETFRAMLDLAGKHYEFRKSD